MWDECIRCDSCQNVLRKTLHSVTKSEQCRVSCPQFPCSAHGMPGTMTPLLATKMLAFYDLGFPTEAWVKRTTSRIGPKYFGRKEMKRIFPVNLRPKLPESQASWKAQVYSSVSLLGIYLNSAITPVCLAVFQFKLQKCRKFSTECQNLIRTRMKL